MPSVHVELYCECGKPLGYCNCEECKRNPGGRTKVYMEKCECVDREVSGILFEMWKAAGEPTTILNSDGYPPGYKGPRLTLTT